MNELVNIRLTDYSSGELFFKKLRIEDAQKIADEIQNNGCFDWDCPDDGLIHLITGVAVQFGKEKFVSLMDETEGD